MLFHVEAAAVGLSNLFFILPNTHVSLAHTRYWYVWLAFSVQTRSEEGYMEGKQQLSLPPLCVTVRRLCQIIPFYVA